jgi:hypothetical protein
MPQARSSKPEQAPEVFRQEADPHGRVRLDRPLTGEEAAEQDKRNRERYVEQRRRRFAGRTS